MNPMIFSVAEALRRARVSQKISVALVAASLSFGAAPAQAQKPLKKKAVAAAVAAGPLDRSKIPDGGPAPKLAFPKPTREKLSSGAQLLVVERHTLPMVEVSVIWPAGGAVEPMATAGLAGLTADLLDEGTTKHGALELADELESLGANLQAGSGWDSTSVTLTSLSKNLDKSLALLAEVVTSPAFADKELERKRAERLTSLAQRKDSATAVATDVYARALYGDDHPFGRPVVGTAEGLKKLTRADVQRWYAERLSAGTATVIVAGDVTAAGAKERLEKAFAGWKSAAPAALAAAAAEAAPPAPRWLIVDKPGAPQSEIRIGQPSVPRSSPDYFPLLVMNTILGGDFSSRLNLNLREQHGYTYGAHSDFAFRKAGGPFVAATAAKTAVTGATLMESMKELIGIRSGQVKDSELRLAKDEIERSMARRFETLGDVFGELAAQVIYQLPDDYLPTYAAKVEAVSAADVLRVAKEDLVPNKMSIVVVGDAKTVWPQVWKLGAFKAADSDGKAVGAAQQ